MFGDNSYRTNSASNNAIALTIAALGITVGSLWFVGGNVQYNNIVAKSSTPIGSPLKFHRSNATMNLKNIYTDSTNSALVAQFAIGEDSINKLPFKGTDYKVYISSASTNGMKEIPILFGRMSTDGDMFLVLPKPTNEVYSVFIMNTNYIETNINASEQSQDQLANLEEESLSQALSSYQYSGDKDNNTGAYKVQGDNFDVISFRLTTNPAFKTDAYKPKLLKSQLIVNDGEKEEFSFESFFNEVYKESATKEVEKKFKDLEKKKSELQKTASNYIERLAENPADEPAQAALEQVNNSIDSLDSQLNEAAKMLAQYSALEYDPALFNNMQTKAKIINKK